MMNEFIFEAPTRSRFHRYGMGVTTFEGLWWSFDQRKWVRDTNGEGGHSTHAPCRTFRAFKRHIRKHAAELYGVNVILTNRFRGHQISTHIKG
jgi:hypothetical protein